MLVQRRQEVGRGSNMEAQVYAPFAEICWRELQRPISGKQPLLADGSNGRLAAVSRVFAMGRKRLTA